jgi:BON domain
MTGLGDGSRRCAPRFGRGCRRHARSRFDGGRVRSGATPGCVSNRAGRGTLLPLLAISFSLVGCADTNRNGVPDRVRTPDTRRIAREAESAVEKAAELGENAVTTGKVKSALIADKAIDASRIDVDTRDGVVTLKGEVATAAQKKRAEAIARKQHGVKQVINNLVVRAK